MASIKQYFAKLRGKRDVSRRLFLGENGLPTNDGYAFLAELRRFCYADKATILRGKDGTVDPYASLVAAGRQEVYMRIIKTMNLSERDMVLMERHADEQEKLDG